MHHAFSRLQPQGAPPGANALNVRLALLAHRLTRRWTDVLLDRASTYFRWDEELQVVFLPLLVAFSVPSPENETTFVPPTSSEWNVSDGAGMVGGTGTGWSCCRCHRGGAVVQAVMQQPK